MIRRIAVAFLVVVFVCLATLMFTGKIGVAKVVSGSMEPALSVNDVVIFAKERAYEAGEIVVFNDCGMTSVHRIVKRSKDEIITKGDSNNVEDEPITEEQVVGKVIFKLPIIGALFGNSKGVSARYRSQGEMSSVARVEFESGVPEGSYRIYSPFPNTTLTLGQGDYVPVYRIVIESNLTYDVDFDIRVENSNNNWAEIETFLAKCVSDNNREVDMIQYDIFGKKYMTYDSEKIQKGKRTLEYDIYFRVTPNLAPILTDVSEYDYVVKGIISKEDETQETTKIGTFTVNVLKEDMK